MKFIVYNKYPDLKNEDSGLFQVNYNTLLKNFDTQTIVCNKCFERKFSAFVYPDTKAVYAMPEAVYYHPKAVYSSPKAKYRNTLNEICDLCFLREKKC